MAPSVPFRQTAVNPSTGEPNTERPSFFLQQVLRLIAERRAATQLTPNGVALLALILAEQDRHRYRPVNFYNGQLQDQCGFATGDTLRKVRKRLIDLGWLEYHPGGPRQPSLYNVTIPPDFEPRTAPTINPERHRPLPQRSDEKLVPSPPSSFPVPVPVPHPPEPEDVRLKAEQKPRTRSDWEKPTESLLKDSRLLDRWYSEHRTAIGLPDTHDTRILVHAATHRATSEPGIADRPALFARLLHDLIRGDRSKLSAENQKVGKSRVRSLDERNGKIPYSAHGLPPSSRTTGPTPLGQLVAPADSPDEPDGN